MEENRSIFQGEVWIEGDMVTYVGQGPETTGGNVPKWDREIDGQGNLLMPGFKNAHTHSAMTFLRSHADDMKLDDWLNKQVFPAEAKLDGEAVYWFTKLAIMEYLTSGIRRHTRCIFIWTTARARQRTVVSVMYFVTASIISAERSRRWRKIICGLIQMKRDRSVIGSDFMQSIRRAEN